ncbi:peptidase domain-containing ABC transporter [Methylobacterium sp. JK268]
MTAFDQRLRTALHLGPSTPVILQAEAAECGLACLAMVAAFHGHRLDLQALRSRFAISMRGATLRDLMRVGTALRLSTRALKLDIPDLASLRLPCILHWQHNHFVVLTRVGPRAAVIHDPACGRRTVPLAELSAKFTGIALELWPTEQFERKRERASISVVDLVRRTAGLGRAALQILAISVLLEITVLTMPIGFQLVLDEVVVAAEPDLLTLICIALVLLLVLQVAAGFARSWATMLIGTNLMMQWKAALFDRLVRLPLAFFEKRHVGDIVSRFGSLDAMHRTLTTRAVQALLDGVMSLTLVVMMGLYGGWLLALALVSVGLYVLLRVLAYARYREISEAAIAHGAMESSHLMETVRGIASVKTLNLEFWRRDTWINHMAQKLNAELRVQRFDAWFQAANTALFGLDRIAMIFVGILAVLGDRLSVGMVVAFLAYKDQFASRVGTFVETMLQFRMLSLHGERLADIALGEPEERRGGAPVLGRQARAASRLEVRDLQFRYADGEPDILSGLSFAVEPGECLGIAGPSGCGKSTLLKILAGLSAPSGGQVLLDGLPLSATGLSAHRERVGCVLQDDRLFAGSIFENIAGFDPEADPQWVIACARFAAIHDQIVQMPMGYETLVGDMGSVLSGGQMQRIVLARAIHRRPGLLLLDEATSHLDPASERAINEAVRKLPMTRIVIAHREGTLALCDRVLTFGRSAAIADRQRESA